MSTVTINLAMRPPDRTGEVWDLDGTLYLVIGVSQPAHGGSVWRHPCFCLEPDGEWDMTHAHEMKIHPWENMERRSKFA